MKPDYEASEADEKELPVPEFKSEIPSHLIGQLSPKEKWFYEQVSLHGKQNEWLIHRAVKVDKNNRAIQRRVLKLEQIRTILGAKWSVVSIIITVLAVPIAVAIFAAWILHKFGLKP